MPGSAEFDPFDIEALRLPGGTVGREDRTPRIPRHGPGEAFLRGPIPFAWVASACRLPGSGLHVALTVRFLRGRFRLGRDRRWTVEAIAGGLGVSNDTVRRGLLAAEAAGLLAGDRRAGRKLIAADFAVVERPKRGDEPTHPPLRGPIPWSWLRPALRLPTRALRVALACWLRAGWERSAAVTIDGDHWPALAGPSATNLLIR